MQEHLLSINEYTTPRVLKDKEAIATLLIRLLLLVPGSIQTKPNMGVGIATNWRYGEMDSLYDLQNEINTQIMTYLPNLAISSVSVDRHPYISTEIIIQVAINNTEVIVLETTEPGSVRLSDFNN